MTGCFCSAIILLIVLLVPVKSSAQPRPLGLDGWVERLHIDMRDQRGAFGGLFFDRGSARFYTPRMDHEYHLDLRSADFNAWWMDGWNAASNGFRTYAGSIDRSIFATTTRFRHHEHVGNRHGLSIDALQQDDLSAERLYVELGYHFNLTGRHSIGVSHTAGSFKPDLDLNLFYAGSLRRAGRVDAGLMLLDWLNNFIYDFLGVDPALDDTVRSYRTIPVLLHGRWRSPASLPFSADIAAGVLPPSHARTSLQSDARYEFDLRHRFRYAGLHLATSIDRYAVAVRHLHTSESRWFTRPETSSARRSYETNQVSYRSSASVAADWRMIRRHTLRTSAMIEHLRYRDRQRGEDFREGSVGQPFDLIERRLEGALALALIPDGRGLRAGLRLLTDSRSYSDDIDVFLGRYLRFAQWSPNQRLSLHLGYQARPGVFLEAGASFDVDGDAFYTDDRGLTRFDGGFGRVSVTW